MNSFMISGVGGEAAQAFCPLDHRWGIEGYTVRFSRSIMMVKLKRSLKVWQGPKCRSDPVSLLVDIDSV
jgi:hypothetical protein